MEIKGKAGNDAFTLIELVMVILLIGILAAVVLPKFVNLTGSANKAASQGVVGSLGEGVTSQLSNDLVNNDLSSYVTVSAGTPTFLGTAPAAKVAGSNPYANPFLTLPNYSVSQATASPWGSGTSYNIVTTWTVLTSNTPTTGNSWWYDYKAGTVSGLGKADGSVKITLTCDNGATMQPIAVQSNEYILQLGNIDYVYSNGYTTDSYVYYMVSDANGNIEGFYLAPCQ